MPLTEQELHALTGERLEAVLWADSYLWPDARDDFEDWLVAEPDSGQKWVSDPWKAYSEAHHWCRERDRKAAEQWPQPKKGRKGRKAA